MANEEFTDAIALLKADHRMVAEMFAEFETTNSAARKWAIAQQICDELKIHATIEEEIFYPACEGKIDDDLYREAFVEHDGAKVLVNDIVASGGEGEFFAAKVTVLAEEIEHHVKEEEKPGDGLFTQAREAGIDLVGLRDSMLARKHELQEQAKNGGLPPAELAVLTTEPA